MLRPLGIAFLVALVASTFVALTLTPVLCSYLLNGKKALKEDKEPWVSRKLQGVYNKALSWAIAHKRGVITGAITLFIAALATFFTLGRSFLPPFNEGSFTINAATLPGVSLEESDRIGQQIERLLLEVPEIQTVARKTGRAELDEHAFGVNACEIEAPFKLDKRSASEVKAEIREKFTTTV